MLEGGGENEKQNTTTEDDLSPPCRGIKRANGLLTNLIQSGNHYLCDVGTYRLRINQSGVTGHNGCTGSVLDMPFQTFSHGFGQHGALIELCHGLCVRLKGKLRDL